MASSRLEDFLQSYRFHLLDVSVSGAFPLFPVFVPVFGFNSISAPEMQAETEQINEGNFEWTRNVIRGGSVSPMTLSRGVRYYDSDFWQWFIASLKGDADKSRRRNLILLHMMNVAGRSATGAGLSAALGLTIGANLAGQANLSELAAVQTAVVGTTLASNWISARAWMLYDTIPTRYKSGSDFDATTSDVSLMEIDIQPTHFEEFSIGL